MYECTRRASQGLLEKCKFNYCKILLQYCTVVYTLQYLCARLGDRSEMGTAATVICGNLIYLFMWFAIDQLLQIICFDQFAKKFAKCLGNFYD